MSIFPLIDGEENDLALHTKICAERYKDLDQRLEKVENKLDDVSNRVETVKKDLKITLIQAVAAIIVALLGATGTIVGVIITHAK
jgi:uncharacterized protein YlxW (UPF0749 family)